MPNKFLFATLFVTFIISTVLGAAWRGCYDPQPESQAGQTTNDHYCAVNGMRSAVNNLGSLIDRLHDDLTAISTFLIAIFTIVLAVVTRRQAILTRRLAQSAEKAAAAAKESADALPALERAYLFIEIDPEFARRAQTYINNITFRDQTLRQTTQTSDFSVRHQFINHGKTPAIVIVISANFCHLTELPPEIRYIDEPPAGEIVIRSGDLYPPPDVTRLPPAMMNALQAEDTVIKYYQRETRIDIAPDGVAARSIKEAKSFLWFYGHIVYSDVFGRPHETRFCWCYNAVANTFQQYNRGNEGLNRRT